MKSQNIFFIIFIFWSFRSYAQEQTIQLKLEEGHEYVFEKIDKVYAVNEAGDKDERAVKKKEICFTVEKVIDGSFVELSLKHLANYHDGPSTPGVLNRMDHFFPDFSEGETQYPDLKEFTEPLLCRSVLRFSIDLKTNEIEFLNRAELLEDFVSRLEEQKYEEETIKHYINSINKKKFFVEEDLISFLTWFNHTRLGSDKTIRNSKLEGKFIVRERYGNFLNFGDQDVENFVPGKKYKKYWINLENGLITNYTTFQRDSIKSRFDRGINKNLWEVNETDFRLLYAQPIPVKKLFVSGKIENPLSNKVHLRFMDDPFGYELRTQTAMLGENGSFSIRFEFKHSGFVYVENENNNKFNPPGSYVFYAQPGDTIHFESKGEELPWKTEVSGTRVQEQKLIQELRSKIRILDGDNGLRYKSRDILDNELSFSFNRNNEQYNQEENIKLLFEAIKDAENIEDGYKTILPEKSFNFITNEVKAYFYGGIFSNGWGVFRKDNIMGLMYYGRKPSKNFQLKDKIDRLDIHEIYNDYGLYSRRSIYYYLFYYRSKLDKVKHRYYSNFLIPNSSDPELELQFSKTVLSGGPLFRDIAANLTKILERRSTSSSQISDEYLKDFALKKYDLMIRRCNDPEVVSQVKEIVAQYEKLQTGKFIPNIDFVDLQHKKVTINDFLGKKPTIFYFSSDWAGARYEYDMMAKGMHEINFVMAVEGTNFEQWEEYTKRAEPVIAQLLYFNEKRTFLDIFQQRSVHLVFNKKGELVGTADSPKAKRAEPVIAQLLYFNEKRTFLDIFQQRSVHLVFNKKGELVGTADSPKAAARMAMDSLNQKKQLDKSQLKIIISILLVSLLTLFIIMLYWKWRVRQRFRKEEQKRRLRELELTAIRSQMNPHFLFNSLNSVQNLVQQNKGREAHLYLADFAGLIRKVLQNSEKEEVSLAEELEMIEQYLSLEELRFDFDYQINIEQGIDPHNTLVPSMLLQPFVENAISHGLQSKTGNRQLKIEVTKADLGIKISIEDNGIGREAAREVSKIKNGKGSKLMKERLEILQQKQGESYRLEITDLNKNGETGTRVDIFIPEEY